MLFCIVTRLMLLRDLDLFELRKERRNSEIVSLSLKKWFAFSSQGLFDKNFHVSIAPTFSKASLGNIVCLEVLRRDVLASATQQQNILIEICYQGCVFLTYRANNFAASEDSRGLFVKT